MIVFLLRLMAGKVHLITGAVTTRATFFLLVFVQRLVIPYNPLDKNVFYLNNIL